MGKHHRSSSTPLRVLVNRNREVPGSQIDEAAGQELEQRLRDMRHDLRTCIGIIQNTLHLLSQEQEEGPPTPRTGRYVEVLVRQASRLEEIVNDSQRPELGQAG